MVSDLPTSWHRDVSLVVGGGPLSIPIPSLVSLAFFHDVSLSPLLDGLGSYFPKEAETNRVACPLLERQALFKLLSRTLENGYCRRPTLLATAIDWSATWKRVRLQARSVVHASGTRSRCRASNHRVRV